jgi:hypothetical protein
MSQYGKFHDFCRDSGSGFATIPVCNLFYESRARETANTPPEVFFGGCQLYGIGLNDGQYLANLGMS